MHPKFTRLMRRLAILSGLLLPFAAQAAVPAGPGAWSSNQTWAADPNHGGNLTGYFYWPASQPVKNGKRALILVLHGCAQTAANDVINGSDGGYNWKAVADQYGAVILAPNATGNVANVHCWNYYGASHTRTSGHNGVLLDLVNRFKNDSKYAIDPAQVYVTGLSSGGGQTMVLGCLAPDVFAGIGNNAGPALGTSSLQIGSVPSGFTAATAAQNCRNIAGSQADKFSTQIANAIWGTSDFTVAQAYGPLNMDAMRRVYGGTPTKGANFTVAGGGTGTPYTIGGKLRTTEISVSGLGHAWPAGAGGQNTNYVNNTTVNYPAYITKFWFDNNLRVTTEPEPPGGVPTGLTVTGTTTNSVSLSWNPVSGATGYNVYRNNVKVTGTPVTATSYTDTGLAASTSYTYTVTELYSGGESGHSTPVTATTKSTFTCTTSTSSNYAHVTAGRATTSGGYTYAKGSNQNMGLYNTFVTTTLAQTAAGYYIIGNCP